MALTNSLMQVVSPKDVTCPVKALAKCIAKVFGATGQYELDINGSPKAMFFQDSLMKDVFNFYPDRMCIDCSFKKCDIDLFMFIFLCEDSNGRNFIVGVGFLQHNDEESLIWLLSTFKKNNPNWRKIRCLWMDPGIQYGELVKKMFNFSCILISAYHTVKMWKNYIENNDVLKTLPKKEKDHALELLKNLIYATTTADYTVKLHKCYILPEAIVSYLVNVWIPQVDKWRVLLDFSNEDIFKNRNEYLEELNNAIQMIFKSEVLNYAECVKKIFLLILLKKREKPHNFMECVKFSYSVFSPEYQICKTLTPYAAEFVIKQLDLSQEIHPEFTDLLSEYSTFKHLDMNIQASPTSCQCNFYLHTLLPCRHIFSVRKTSHLCLFDYEMDYMAWKKLYYEHASSCMEDYIGNSVDSRIPRDLASRNVLASHLFQITTPILLESSESVYKSRIAALRMLDQAWCMNNDVSVKFIGIKDDVKDDASSNSSSPLLTPESNVLQEYQHPEIDGAPCNAENVKSLD